MITAYNISKSFDDTHVLRGLDLDIRKSGIYGLAGRSGAGKSTLLRCINGLETYDSGSLVVDGVDVKTLSRKDMMVFRKNIGMIFQNFSLLERLTVYDNVALPLRCWKYKTSFIDTKVRELLETVGIPEKINQKPRELSGGQKQRVAIARALTMDPHILLCDEATSALDPKTSQSIISLLKEINKQMGITIVCVTHQISILRGLCREIAILENGKVAAVGTVEEIFRHRPRALQNLIGEDVAVSVEESMKSVSLLLPDTITGSFISCMATDLGIGLTIQGRNPGCSGETVPGLAISFPENSYDEIERYLVRHDVIWKKLNLNNNCPEPVETYKDEYQTQMSVIQS
jgi:D-methionine transport system ATP-binding protein